MSHHDLLLHLLFLLLRPPPISTLFPYTTLFRSSEYRVSTADRDRDAIALFSCVSCAARCRSEDPEPAPLAGSATPIAAKEHEDRKSTRLNSSHRCISYAVFCLKKKN